MGQSPSSNVLLTNLCRPKGRREPIVIQGFRHTEWWWSKWVINPPGDYLNPITSKSAGNQEEKFYRYKRRRPARAFAQRDPARIPAPAKGPRPDTRPPNADGDSDSDEDPPPPLVGQLEIQT